MSSVPQDSQAEEIRGLDAAWKAAASRRDLNGMMAIFATDAKELLPGRPSLVGHPAIREFYRNLLEAFPNIAHDFEAHEILVADSGDLTVGYGSYHAPVQRKPREAPCYDPRRG